MSAPRGLLLGLVVVVAALAAALALGGRSLVFRAMGWLSGRGSPAIRWVDGAALALELDSPTPPLLLDVREPAEFDVSHLPDARRLPPGEVPAEFLALPRATPIVTYCAVGIRSGQAARALTRAGFSDVRNLEGSIFAWANAGRPLVNAAGPATTVHPVSALWRLVLLPGRRAPLP